MATPVGGQSDAELRFQATMEDDVSPQIDKLEKKLKEAGATDAEISMMLKAYDEASPQIEEVQKNLDNMPKEQVINIKAASDEARSQLDQFTKGAEETPIRLKFLDNLQEVTDKLFNLRTRYALPLMGSIGGGAATSMIYGLGAGAGVVGAGTAAIGAIQQGIQVNQEMEQSMVTLTQTLRDQAQAKQEMSELIKFAQVSPFQYQDVLQADVRLRSYQIPSLAGEGGPDNRGWLQSAGDMAAAMGTPITQAVEAIADARQGYFIRMMTYGIRMMREDFQKGGRYAGLSYEQGLARALQRFEGSMEMQSKTLTGVLSNIKDIVQQQFYVPLGQEPFGIKKELATNLYETMGDPAFLRELGKVMEDIQAKMVEIWGMVEKGQVLFRAHMLRPLQEILKSLVEIGQTFGQAFGGATLEIVQTIGSSLVAITGLVTKVGANVPKFVEFYGIMKALSFLGFKETTQPFFDLLSAINPLTFSLTGLVKGIIGLPGMFARLAMFKIAKDFIDAKEATNALNSQFEKLGEARLDKLNLDVERLAMGLGESSTEMKNLVTYAGEAMATLPGSEQKRAKAAIELAKQGEYFSERFGVGAQDYVTMITDQLQRIGKEVDNEKLSVLNRKAVETAIGLEALGQSADKATENLSLYGQLAGKAGFDKFTSPAPTEAMLLGMGELTDKQVEIYKNPMGLMQSMYERYSTPPITDLRQLKQAMGENFDVSQYFDLNNPRQTTVEMTEDQVRRRAMEGFKGKGQLELIDQLRKDYGIISEVKKEGGETPQISLQEQYLANEEKQRQTQAMIANRAPSIAGKLPEYINPAISKGMFTGIESFAPGSKPDVNEAVDALLKMDKTITNLNIKIQDQQQIITDLTNKQVQWQIAMDLINTQMQKLQHEILPVQRQMEDLQLATQKFAFENIRPLEREMTQLNNQAAIYSDNMRRASYEMNKYSRGLLDGEQAAKNQLHNLEMFNKELQLLQLSYTQIGAELGRTTYEQGFQSRVEPLAGISLNMQMQRLQREQQRKELEYELSYGEQHYRMQQAQRSRWERTEMPFEERMKHIRNARIETDKMTESQYRLQNTQFELGQDMFKLNEYMADQQDKMTALQLQITAFNQSGEMRDLQDQQYDTQMTLGRVNRELEKQNINLVKWQDLLDPLKEAKDRLNKSLSTWLTAEGERNYKAMINYFEEIGVLVPKQADRMRNQLDRMRSAQKASAADSLLGDPRSTVEKWFDTFTQTLIGLFTGQTWSLIRREIAGAGIPGISPVAGGPVGGAAAAVAGPAMGAYGLFAGGRLAYNVAREGAYGAAMVAGDHIPYLRKLNLVNWFGEGGMNLAARLSASSLPGTTNLSKIFAAGGVEATKEGGDLYKIINAMRLQDIGPLGKALTNPFRPFQTMRMGAAGMLGAIGGAPLGPGGSLMGASVAANYMEDQALIFDRKSLLLKSLKGWDTVQDLANSFKTFIGISPKLTATVGHTPPPGLVSRGIPYLGGAAPMGTTPGPVGAFSAGEQALVNSLRTPFRGVDAIGAYGAGIGATSAPRGLIGGLEGIGVSTAPAIQASGAFRGSDVLANLLKLGGKGTAGRIVAPLGMALDTASLFGAFGKGWEPGESQRAGAFGLGGALAGGVVGGIAGIPGGPVGIAGGAVTGAALGGGAGGLLSYVPNQIWKALSEAFKPSNLFKAIGNPATAIGSLITQKIISPFLDLLEKIPVLGDVIHGLREAANWLKGGFDFLAGGALKGLFAAAKWAAKALWDTFKWIVTAVKDVFMFVTAPLRKLAELIWDLVDGPLKAIGKWIVNAAKNAFHWIVNAAKDFWDWIKGAGKWIGEKADKIADAAHDVWKWVTNAANDFADIIHDAAEAIAWTFGDVVNAVYTALDKLPFVSGLAEGYVSPREKQEALDAALASDTSDPSVGRHVKGPHSDQGVPNWRAGGFRNVPYDNYPAVLHAGEAVLQAGEANNWRMGGGKSGDEEENRAKEVEQARHLKRMEEGLFGYQTRTRFADEKDKKETDQRFLVANDAIEKAQKASQKIRESMQDEHNKNNAQNIRDGMNESKTRYDEGWKNINQVTNKWIGEVQKAIKGIDEDLGLTKPGDKGGGGRHSDKPGGGNPALAYGGLIPGDKYDKRGTLIRVGEEGFDEMVIPLAPHRRDRAVNLMKQAKMHIGEFAAGGVPTIQPARPGYDGAYVAAKKAYDTAGAFAAGGRGGRHSHGEGASRGRQIPKSGDMNDFSGPHGALAGMTPLANFAASKFSLQVTSGRDDHSPTTTSGNTSDHSWGGALDLSNGTAPTPQMDAFYKFMHDKLGKAIKQLIYKHMGANTGPSDWYYSGSDHFNHVHTAMLEQYASNPPLMAQILKAASEGISISALLTGSAMGGGMSSVTIPDVPKKLKKLGPLGLRMYQALKRKQDQYQQKVGSTGGIAGGLAGIPASGNLQQMAKKMVIAAWGSSQWPYFNDLVNRESSWDPTIVNSSSGAAGLAQALPPSKYPAGAWPYTGPKSAQLQLQWMINYIKGRYGTPADAIAFHNANNWYAAGGIVPALAGGGFTSNVPSFNFAEQVMKGAKKSSEDATAGKIAGYEIPAMFEKINKVYEDHWAPDWSGETLPTKTIAALAEWAGDVQNIDVPGVTMAQMTKGESGGRPGSAGVDPGGTKGYGMWAITSPFNDALVKQFGGYKQMWNPIKNALAMAQIYKTQGLGAWYGDQYVTDPNAHYSGKGYVGGIGRVPSTGPANLHEGEMVLPSGLADLLRSLAKQAKGSGPNFGSYEEQTRRFNKILDHMEDIRSKIRKAERHLANAEDKDEKTKWKERISKLEEHLADATKNRMQLNKQMQRQTRKRIEDVGDESGGEETLAGVSDEEEEYRAMIKKAVDRVKHGKRFKKEKSEAKKARKKIHNIQEDAGKDGPSKTQRRRIKRLKKELDDPHKLVERARERARDRYIKKAQHQGIAPDIIDEIAGRDERDGRDRKRHHDGGDNNNKRDSNTTPRTSDYEARSLALLEQLAAKQTSVNLDVTAQGAKVVTKKRATPRRRR